MYNFYIAFILAGIFMKKWLLGIGFCVFVVMGILASSIGLTPDLAVNSSAIFSFATGVTGFGRILSLLVLAILIVFAVVVIVSALVDFFSGSKYD